MTEPRLPNHEDTSTREGRFGQRNARRYSGWSSAGAIIIIVIILGIVFAYVAMHTR
jgi:tetrahydromethanopterin S-methyltransferase subunit F